MKANVFLTMISVILALLIGYLAYTIAEDKANDSLCGVGTSLCLIATLVPTIGLQSASGRMGTNIRVYSALFLIIFLISNFCFASFVINVPYYIITNGIMLVIFLAIFYKMQNNTSI